MPLLAGKPFPAPRFLETTWEPNQIFVAEDDPDRTSMPWSPPRFIYEDNPSSRPTSVEELQLPAPPLSPSSTAKVVRGVLSEEQCAILLSSINEKKFTPALINIGGGKQRFVVNIRDGYRAIVDSPEMASWLFQVLRPYLPEVLSDGSRLVELNERLRFLCYTTGQMFHVHRDGQYTRLRDHARLRCFKSDGPPLSSQYPTRIWWSSYLISLVATSSTLPL